MHPRRNLFIAAIAAAVGIDSQLPLVEALSESVSAVYELVVSSAHARGDDRDGSGSRDDRPDPPPMDEREALIAEGERLFFEETFDGNGRTCGTCHRRENNFTIDPVFIATLPPSDPLFVAETNPDLAGLEIPILMRRFGLIVENVDGTQDPTNKFTMRSVPHTLALATSIGSASTEAPLQNTGWSGDGAPGDGTLREFAAGAVVQHFTRSLERVPGRDFRLPTPAELEALEAFQLSLGRHQDLDLTLLRLRGTVAQSGLDMFVGTVGKCNTCHVNAGANFRLAPDENRNFDTGVEDLVDQPARLVMDFPFDGGLGTDPDGGRLDIPNPDGSFGNGTFNTPPLVEAADTAPFFHNNSVATLEDAVAFYNSDAFNNSPAAVRAGPIHMEPDQVVAVAAFLRVLNALENIRQASDLETRALAAWNWSRRRDPVDGRLRQAYEETEDAVRVLREGSLHPDVVLRLALAQRFLKTAMQRRSVLLVLAALRAQAEARALLVDES